MPQLRLEMLRLTAPAPRRSRPACLPRRLPLLLAPALALATGCSERRSPPAGGGLARACVPGETQDCVCGGGRPGGQICSTDGTHWGPCDCDAGARPPAPADTGPPDTGSADAARPVRDAGRPPAPDAGPTDTGVPPGTDAGAPRDADAGAARDADAGAERDADASRADASDAAPPAPAALGEDCERASGCLSGICLGLGLAGRQHSVCASPCCHEEECPAGFGCLQAGAGRYCLPARIFPAGYTFDAATGQACGPGGHACKSGICDLSRDLCRGTCCGDRDCLAAPCHWSLTGETLRTFCDPAALVLSGDGRTGTPCASELDCRSGVCAASGEPPAFACADLCCGPRECPAGTTCGLVAGLGGAVVRACVTLPVGAAGDGTPCADDGEGCAGGHCFEGHCRRICCLDEDCPPGWRCLPRESEEGVLAPVCVQEDEG